MTRPTSDTLVSESVSDMAMSSMSTLLDDMAVTALRVGSSGLTMGEIGGGDGRTTLDSVMLTGWVSLSSEPTTADLKRQQ